MKRFWWILFLLLIPTQLGKHFWFEWSQIRGVRIDYLAPVLYLIDIAWVGVIIISNFKFQISNWKKWGWMGIVVLINILVAGNKEMAVYSWIRILQWIITVKLITNYQLRITNYLKWIIPIWIIGESLLGLGQIINGGSFQEIFYWLGERRFSLTTIGIAQMSWLGQGMLRAYGTFSHPNSLAGFLLVCWVWWNKKFQITNYKLRISNIFYWIVNWMAILGIVISGSRTIWIILLGIFLYKWKKYAIIFVGSMMMILGIVAENYQINDFVGGWDKKSMVKRWELNIEAMEMMGDYPLLGVGSGNYLYKGQGMQPVHNIFLLVVSEMGWLILVVVIYKYRLVVARILGNRDNWLILGIIIITGMVDHYWVTLPQNRWLLAVVMGMMVGRNRKHVTRNPNKTK